MGCWSQTRSCKSLHSLGSNRLRSHLASAPPSCLPQTSLINGRQRSLVACLPLTSSHLNAGLSTPGGLAPRHHSHRHRLRHHHHQRFTLACPGISPTPLFPLSTATSILEASYRRAHTRAKPKAKAMADGISRADKYQASTEYGQKVEGLEPPYVPQDPQETASVLKRLEAGTTKDKSIGFHVRKTRYVVGEGDSATDIISWRFHDHDYKKGNLPTYARGLFTTKGPPHPEIAVRGYNKFFNVGEVSETKWTNILQNTVGPYELTLKENGCIIFLSGLANGSLLVCSKHSTGTRGGIEVSHAEAGEKRLEEQLARIGKTKRDLAQDLRQRNATAVIELCDDSFEEHILAYEGKDAGLYLHGININVPDFVTYPSPLVQKFADEWGFVKTGLIMIDSVDEVRAFLEEVAETGAHGGRDVEGWVIRCKRKRPGNDAIEPEKQLHDWFFKYKFDEPYLMYRQWRECTKTIISGKAPIIRKHKQITEEYLNYARKRLTLDKTLGKRYTQNHGIIKLRNDFLEFKHLKGSDAANLEDTGPATDVTRDVTRDVVLVPIATIGCGKTTVALALTKLFGWGHIQNDNFSGPRRPPRFTRAVLEELSGGQGGDAKAAVIADRNNAQKNERKQLIGDIKLASATATVVALYFKHDDMGEVQRVTEKRVLDRGDNHQTIQAATDMKKVRGIMEGFRARFEPYDTEREPDAGFDAMIELDPLASSRDNVETVLQELHRLYPNFLPEVPSADKIDQAVKEIIEGYNPTLGHTIPDRKNRNGPNNVTGKDHQPRATKAEKKPVEYISVDVPTRDVLGALEKTFASAGPERAHFFRQLQGSRRLQAKFHVTLIHRTAARERPELWNRYLQLHEAAGGKLGEVDVMLERVVFDNRIMAVVVQLLPATPPQQPDSPAEGSGAATPSTTQQQQQPAAADWECANRVAHITVGTRDASVKPKESNDLLARLDEPGGDKTHIDELAVDGKPVLKGVVRGVLSR